MSFDQNVYAALASNPAAQQAYLSSFSAPAAPPAPQAAAPAAPAPQVTSQPQAGYSNPAAVQPQPVLARGTLEDFYNQPSGSGGGPSVTSKFFTKRVQGSWLQLRVVADVTNADVRQQTTPQGIPQTFKDRRPKFVLVVKVQVLGSSDNTHLTEFPDGLGSLWVKGELADELRRSMAAGGDPSGYPKGGADIVMQSDGERASRTPGFSATKLYKLQYAGPAAPADPTATAAAPAATEVAAAPVAAPQVAAPVAPPAVPAPNFTPPAPPAPPTVGTDKNALLAALHGNS